MINERGEGGVRGGEKEVKGEKEKIIKKKRD